jgi:hypothetical protein
MTKVAKMKKVRRAFREHEDDDNEGFDNDGAGPIEVSAATGSEEPEWVETTTQSPFLVLNIEIPASPLFKDSEGGLVIPQIPLLEVLKKYDGETWTDHVGASGLERKRYRLLKLPQYLIFHLGRFTMNNFNLEKNHTIVTFPVKNLEMKDYLQTTPQTPVRFAIYVYFQSSVCLHNLTYRWRAWSRASMILSRISVMTLSFALVSL